MKSRGRKTSKAAVASYVLGCVVLTIWGLSLGFGNMFPGPQGFVPLCVLEYGIFFLTLNLLIILLPFVALITALAAQHSVHRSKDTLRGTGLAWFGFVLTVMPWILSAIPPY